MRSFFSPKMIDGPKPLEVAVPRIVRFEECDPLNIMWHGRYASFLEDAREEIGRKYDISYNRFKNNGIALPIKIMHIDYCYPLHYQEKCRINLFLHWSDAARINIEYKIYNNEMELTTRAYTVQLMVDFAGQLMLNPPQFYKEFRARWEAGELSE